MPTDDVAKRFEERLNRQAQASEERLAEATDELVAGFGSSVTSSARTPHDATTPPSHAHPAVEAQVLPGSASLHDFIHILHLSDLHIESIDQAHIYRTQIETDLIQELGVQQLEYLVISGDIANCAQETDYEAACHLVEHLMQAFHLDSGRVIVVPGNHDANWDLSRSAYAFVHKDHLTSLPPPECTIPAGEAGVLVRNNTRYRERFAVFDSHFYRPLYNGQRYPLDYAGQVHLVKRYEDRILFLGLNSSWQVDHYFRRRAGIHMPALVHALDSIQQEDLSGWLKIALWHHPVSGKEMMDDEFLELLEAHGFQICMHGHIHEAIEVFHKYDERRGIYIVGAGAFGAPTKENPESRIPLQYNLLAYDPASHEIVVHTRKKEKPNGTWSADARWGDRHAPVPWYHIKIPAS